MQEYEISYSKESLGKAAEETFTPLYNFNRVSSHEGELIFTPNEIYFFFTNPMEKKIFKPWSIEIREILEYKKSGLAGYVISLKDGKVLRFSNVFRKMRNGITEAINRRRN